MWFFPRLLVFLVGLIAAAVFSVAALGLGAACFLLHETRKDLHLSGDSLPGAPVWMAGRQIVLEVAAIPWYLAAAAALLFVALPLTLAVLEMIHVRLHGTPSPAAPAVLADPPVAEPVPGESQSGKD